jgi:hypothetical protein
MAKRNPQTAAKRAREQAKREKRERKQETKAAAAAAKLEQPAASETDLDPEAPDPAEQD